VKKNITIIALIVVALILLYFLLHEPKQHDSHKDDYARIVSENKQLQAEHSVALKKVDSLEATGRAKDSANTALKAEKKAVQKEADKYASAATRLAKEAKELRKGDTSEFAQKCDSLAEQAASFAFLYEQYKVYSDSLTTQVEQSKGDYAAALAEQKRLYAELKKQYDALLTAYKTLFDDYAKNQKTVRRERLKTKIAALLALIGGAAAIINK
jgi:chromosome segregation ATPase